ncbi:cell division protein FtsQ/DivIB [Acinetobacter rathckeae]|uniref:cell division protein FtsQ/DivIB n=1 Tax=Acinetobacter rathckeae TaxID=2605272 RepID=UPI0018A2B1C0|nr:cell division protein FtsQ/DivIB [Acinetobacter rathckeae]MBF7688262.1 cell division protein FtsQ/DivIB [Acinetobacter rathckeae]MBF7695220.1 cell division protein FtsQ/DivIB [Acinetobacter rathckeae]
MAQLPASMRRKQQQAAAVTSIHDKPPSLKDRLISIGGWIILLFAACVLLVGIYSSYKMLNDARVANVEVVGTRSVAEQQSLLQSIRPVVNKNYFTVDLEGIRDQALALPWVEQVVVSRAWPDEIKVRIIPRHAVARWGTGRLLSDSGIVFKEVTVQDNQSLPLLHGPVSQAPFMMRRYHEINQLFRPYHLRLTELYLTERMTWFMQFDSGLRLIVDQDQTMSKLQHLSQLAGQDLQPVWSQISTVDLRYRNGLSIQWKGVPPVSHGQFVVTNRS